VRFHKIKLAVIQCNSSSKFFKSGKDCPQSKNLAEFVTLVEREASWIAPALWRFGPGEARLLTSRRAGDCTPYPENEPIKLRHSLYFGSGLIWILWIQFFFTHFRFGRQIHFCHSLGKMDFPRGWIKCGSHTANRNKTLLHQLAHLGFNVQRIRVGDNRVLGKSAHFAPPFCIFYILDDLNLNRFLRRVQ
jgi:hypothetical protein